MWRRLTFDRVFVNPVLEDTFHSQFQPARLAVARGTGQWINLLGFIVNALTWFQDPPSRFACLVCIVIYTAATPINYLPVTNSVAFVDAIYRPITRLCSCFVGLMPEKHFLFAALHQVRVCAVAVCGVIDIIFMVIIIILMWLLLRKSSDTLQLSLISFQG